MRPLLRSADDAADLCADVRWLARRILPGHPALDALPAPSRVSVELARNPLAREYLVHWARHPEAGGAFASATRELRQLSDGALLQVLAGQGYDGILYALDREIVGHVVYQRHGAALHGFSVAVDGAFTGQGCSPIMMYDYLAEAARLPGVARARVGRGQNNVTRRTLERLGGHADALGWRVQADGWVLFSAGAISP